MHLSDVKCILNEKITAVDGGAHQPGTRPTLTTAGKLRKLYLEVVVKLTLSNDMNLITFILKLSMLICSLSSDNSSSCDYAVEQILKEAKVFHDSVVNSNFSGQDFLKTRVSYSSKFRGFDFKNFVPISGDIDSTEYYKIGYNSVGAITEINHYENKANLNNWRMVLYHSKNFIIVGVEDWTDNYLRTGESYDFLPGFLVYLKASKTMFFINTYPLGNLQFKPIFPVFGLTDISYVAKVNPELQMTRLFRFIDGKISFFSEIELYEDNRRIIREVVYEPMMKNLILNEKTCFNSFDSYADSHKELSSMKVKIPCIPKDNSRFPLWFFGGAHNYCD